ncbi:hypothetical protein [Pelagibius sp.]|uniref:hypothetical protein n=1 Tax=Pelagibius sp. TaxID=1931238 RepID=UPI00261C0140|nr:hypothetical protein [Pelagibius sp.]
MRRLPVLLLVVSLVVPSLARADAAAVDQSFQAYRTAIMASDGAKAAAVVTQGSHDLYRQYADQALTLDRSGLNALHVMDRTNVLLLRHSLDRPRMETMSGEEIIAFAVDQGWIGKEGAERLQLGDYAVAGDAATGTVLAADGRRTSFQLQFLKEAERWRLDLVSMLNITRTAIEYSVKQSGMTEDEFLFLVLEISTGRKAGPEIWNPPS